MTLTLVQAAVRAGDLGLSQTDLAYMNEPVEISEVDLKPAGDQGSDEASEEDFLKKQKICSAGDCLYH